MNFLKKGKTNWKYILIVVVLAFIVGKGILTYQVWMAPKEETRMPEEKPEEKIEEIAPEEKPSEEITEDKTLEPEVLLDPSKPPEEMRICKIDSDCVMAGLVGKGPDYGCYACKCINKRYENKFRECGAMWKCLGMSTYCECINNKCESKIQEHGF